MNAVLALGSNLGDRFAHLHAAVALIGEQATIRAVSPVYETQPVGGPEQGPFLNAVLIAMAGLEPCQWLALAQSAEHAANRVRAERWGPRSLDVDVIDLTPEAAEAPNARPVQLAEPELTLPHPGAATRAFVLVPWLAADPDAHLTGHGSVADLVADLETAGVVRRDDLGALR